MNTIITYLASFITRHECLSSRHYGPYTIPNHYARTMMETTYEQSNPKDHSRFKAEARFAMSLKSQD
ncbi:unnamed protein product [Zymoseptoria tritici ST99CH_3D7]|uniref:Uncharacterized protein n=1 Tax=Zymoseptoria tritici (strain ST99CH_3D7) TaxID=1276538 RepID=A0A1X7RU78_ZYMT9|nr:unnamed protein product [Zymoseptoria tritici ST99CH_3D7]